jgi:two-component system response regulator HydG
MTESKLRILVVDDDRRMAKTLVDIFQVKGYEAEAAHSGPEALEKVLGDSFDCILADIKMPGVNGVQLYRTIKARRPDLPVVLMTAYSSDEQVREGLEEGVVAVLTKPLEINLLLSFFSSLRQECSIVIVDDDHEFCKTLGDILRARGFAVTQIIDPHDVVGRIKPDGQVVLLDMKLNDVSGLEVLEEIRAQYPRLPVVLVTGYRQEMALAIEAALKIGAYTCLYKPFPIEELIQLLTEVCYQELGRVLGRPARKGKGR